MSALCRTLPAESSPSIRIRTSFSLLQVTREDKDENSVDIESPIWSCGNEEGALYLSNSNSKLALYFFAKNHVGRISQNIGLGSWYVSRSLRCILARSRLIIFVPREYANKTWEAEKASGQNRCRLCNSPVRSGNKRCRRRRTYQEETKASPWSSRGIATW